MQRGGELGDERPPNRLRRGPRGATVGEREPLVVEVDAVDPGVRDERDDVGDVLGPTGRVGKDAAAITNLPLPSVIDGSTLSPRM